MVFTLFRWEYEGTQNGGNRCRILKLRRLCDANIVARQTMNHRRGTARVGELNQRQKADSKVEDRTVEGRRKR
jgi:hypothetical protein